MSKVIVVPVPDADIAHEALKAGHQVAACVT